jgi:MFS family permease
LESTGFYYWFFELEFWFEIGRSEMKFAVKSLKFFYGFSFFMNLFVGMLFLGMPLFAIKLGADNLDLGILGTAGSLVYILFVPVSGWLSDRTRKNLQAGLSAIMFGVMVCLIPFMPRLFLLYPVMLGYFIALALVWPALESAMSHYASGKTLSRIAGWYNVSWCSGAMLGIYVAGYIYSRNSGLVFWLAGGLAILLGISFAGWFQVPERANNQGDALESGSVYFLYLSWLANGMSYFSLNLIRMIFPKLAVDLSISSSNLGLLLMLLNFSQALMFIVLNLTVRWHFKFWVLALAMVLNATGQFLVFFSEDMAGFGLGFFLIGAGAGISYSTSLYYAISLSASLAGSRSGWHEFYLGLGALLGPLLGGVSAQYLGARSPYALSAILAILLMLVQIFYFSIKAGSVRA